MHRTYLLIGLNTIVFIFQILIDSYFLNYPYNDIKYNILNIIPSMFSHGSFFHFLNNMYILFLLGGYAEFLFKQYYFYTYLIAGIFSNIITSLFYTMPSLGASGSIFCVLGILSAVRLANELQVIFINIKFSIESFCNFNFYISVIFSTYYIFSGINFLYIAHAIHVIGFLMGYISVKLFYMKYKIIVGKIRI